jgi:hypothetical protein
MPRSGIRLVANADAGGRRVGQRVGGEGRDPVAVGDVKLVVTAGGDAGDVDQRVVVERPGPA